MAATADHLAQTGSTLPAPGPVEELTMTTAPTALPGQTLVVFTGTPGDLAPVATLLVTDTPTPSGPCNVVRPGAPLDVTILDGEPMKPQQSFTKTWRVVNAGSCVWTEEYALVWFSGDRFGGMPLQHLHRPVQPGEQIDLSVDMVAPSLPGEYQSNWIFQSPDGQVFGIGPNGTAPIWVRVEVLGDATPTALPVPTNTPEAVQPIVSQGSLNSGESLDLDSGTLTEAGEADVQLIVDMTNIFNLIPLNDARLGAFGTQVPSVGDCAALDLSTDRVNLSELPPDSYLCYQSGLGSVGVIQLQEMDLDTQTFQFSFFHWSLP
ncbi:MAG: hypothetical protein GYA17_22540 [Chloroflexi bacterium]|nr:hypothetical protein [Chloroflexota bacterium]